MEKQKMPTNVLNNIKGRELPKDWAEKIKAVPDESYTVTIRPQKESKTLKQVMSELSRKAQARGLTPEKLEEILGEKVTHILYGTGVTS